MFRRFFGGGDDHRGGPSQKAVDQQITAKEKLQKLSENLDRRREVLNESVNKENAAIKVLLAENNKPQALVRLKKKKLLEIQIEGINQNSQRVQEQIMQMDTATIQVDTVAALATAAKAQKAQLEENKIENVQDVLNDIIEANQDMADIADALAAPTGVGATLDIDDLDAELAAMGEEVLDAELMGAGAVPQQAVKPAAGVDMLPSAPTGPAAVKKTPEELELEELQKAMGLEAA